MSISWLQLLSKRLLLDFFLVSASQVMITDSINMFFYFFFLDGLFQYACHKYSFFFCFGNFVIWWQRYGYITTTEFLQHHFRSSLSLCLSELNLLCTSPAFPSLPSMKSGFLRMECWHTRAISSIFSRF